MAIRQGVGIRARNATHGVRHGGCEATPLAMEALAVRSSCEALHDRLRRNGVDALSDHELLSFVIGSGRGGEPLQSFALRLLGAYGGARGLLRAAPAELASTLGFARAVRLASAVELARRSLARPLSTDAPVGSSREVVRAFAPRLADRANEEVIVVILDARHRWIAERRLASGGPTACYVGIREVFALAVREGGSSIVVVHNHPSGDPTPSREDVGLTRALAEAGRVLQLPLLDHVIVARAGSFSFLDAGLLIEPRRVLSEVPS